MKFRSALLIAMLAQPLISLPSLADEIPACGGLYTTQYNRCTLPEGLIEYGVEIAGASGGAGSMTDVSIPSPYAKIAGSAGGRGRIHVVNLQNSGSQSELIVGVGHQGRSGLTSNYLSEVAGGVAAEGSQGGASWGGRDFVTSIAGTSGGSGGGASDLRTSSSNAATRFLIAGGGGGAGAGNFDSHVGGLGGDAGTNGHSASMGSTTSQTSTNLGDGTAGRCPFEGLGGAGGAGTQNSTGGGGGSGCNTGYGATVGAAGTAGQPGGDITVNLGYGGRPGVGGIGGANGQGTYTISGGAGGGGYFGGGAGGDGGTHGAGGGGGGGSSLIPSNASLQAEDWNAGDGYVQLSLITSSLPSSSRTMNSAFSHQVSVSGFRTSPSDIQLTVTYSLANAPSGLSINSSTGLISGTISELGQFNNVQVTASAPWPNGGTLRSIQRFTLNVSKIDQSSSLSIPKTMKKNSSKTFTVANLKTSAGQEIILSTLGTCSVKATYKYVKTKVGKKTKKIKTLTGYRLTMGKKANKTCSVTQYAKPTDSYNEFSSSSNITIR